MSVIFSTNANLGKTVTRDGHEFTRAEQRVLKYLALQRLRFNIPDLGSQGLTLRNRHLRIGHPDRYLFATPNRRLQLREERIER